MKLTPVLAAVAAAAAAASAWPAVALARDPVPQNNEFAFDVDATFGKAGQNDSNLLLVYSWIPAALDQHDEVVPALRRFVRHPSELNVRLQRQSDALDTVTGLYGGGTGWLPGGLLFGSIDLGFEYDQVTNERMMERESAFISASGRIEGGMRVLPLLQLSGFYRVRPVLLPLPEVPLTNERVERSGATQELGLGFGLATPDDRLLLSGAVGVRAIDWTFIGGLDTNGDGEGDGDGDVEARGVFGTLRLSLQSSPRTSWFLRTEVASTDWHNGRNNHTAYTQRAADAVVGSLQADGGVVYWFEGHWGFRLSFGGGYVQEGPLIRMAETGQFRMGVGFTTRY